MIACKNLQNLKLKSAFIRQKAKYGMKNILFVFLFVNILIGQTHFTFAHVTDTHVGSSTGEADLKRTVDDINSLHDVAFVIITGDITEFGFDDELRKAKLILDRLTIPWFIIPGNHDMKWSGSGGFSFSQIFGYERISFDYDTYRFIGMHQGPILRMGDGHWSPQDVRWLDSVLSAATQNQKIIFFTHYPLNSEIDNWFVVLDKLKAKNVVSVLFGHGHRNTSELFEGIPGIMGRSNLRARDSLGGYNIAEIRNDTLLYFEKTPGISSARLWSMVPLAANRKQEALYPRPDYSVNTTYPEVQIRWKHETGYTIASTPAKFENSIIVGDASGTIRSLDITNGKEIWSYATNGPIYSSPAVEGKNVVFGSADSSIYCLDAIRGSFIWKFKTYASVVASPIIRNGIVFIGSSDGRFRGLRMTDGSLQWEYSGIKGFIESTPAYAKGKVIFGAWDEHLYCLNADTGDLLWKWNSGRKGILLSPAACEPVIADGKVFIVAPDRYMTSIDGESGRTVWRTNQFQVRETIGGSTDGKDVYVRTMNDSIYALSAEADFPSVHWSFNAGFGYDINSAMIKEKDGIVFYPTKNGLVLAVESNTGKIVWKHKTGVGITNTILPIDKNTIIVTDMDGRAQMVSTAK